MYLNGGKRRSFILHYLFSTSLQRATTDERQLLFLIGISPPPGTPPDAPSGYVSIIMAAICFRSFRELPQNLPNRHSSAQHGAASWESCLSYDNSSNVSVEGIFNCQPNSGEKKIPSIGRRRERQKDKTHFKKFLIL